MLGRFTDYGDRYGEINIFSEQRVVCEFAEDTERYCGLGRGCPGLRGGGERGWGRDWWRGVGTREGGMEWFYTGEDISFEIYFIEGMTTSRKEALDKEKAVVLSKDYATKNPILALEHVEELFNLFALYMDPRNKKTDVRDILMTAKTLGLDQKYQLVFRALEEVADGRHGDPIDFETFIKDLTAKMVQFRLIAGEPIH